MTSRRLRLAVEAHEHVNTPEYTVTIRHFSFSFFSSTSHQKLPNCQLNRPVELAIEVGLANPPEGNCQSPRALQ
jgi:hypothetical protein